MAHAARQLQRRYRPIAITPLRGIREAVSRHTRVLYARGADLADGFPVLDVDAAERDVDARWAAGTRRRVLRRERDDGRAALHAASIRRSTSNWRDGAPRADMNVDDFGVRWSGTFRAAADRHVPARVSSAR